MKKDKKKVRLTSSCDDDMFMQGEIHLELDPSDGLNGIELRLELQSRQPIYLRKGEIKELADNLMKLHDLIS